MRGYTVIAWPDSVDTAEWLGGKAKGLLSLVRLGVTVPEYFCVRLMQQGDSPGEGVVWRDTCAALRRLGPPPWIVRSSANGEDSSTHSYAGMFRSIVAGSEDSVLRGLIECLESLRGKRVQAYCAAKKIELPTEMCAIVQRFVEAKAAGVAFSRHPVLSDEGSIWIEANHGAGSSVVDGAVTPDRWMVQNDHLRVARFTMGTKRVMDVYSDGKVVRKPTTKAERTRPCLSDAQVILIASLVKRMHDSLRFHIDAEWVWDGDAPGVFMVQVRPVTSSATFKAQNERCIHNSG